MITPPPSLLMPAMHAWIAACGFFALAFVTHAALLVLAGFFALLGSVAFLVWLLS